MEQLSLDDMMQVGYRRRGLFAVSVAIIFLATLVVSLSWSRYRATATIEIAQPAIASNVASVAGSDSAAADIGLADRRIAQIAQKVTATDSLAAIIQQLGLYPGAGTPPKLSEAMRKNIKLTFIGSSIANPAAVQKESVEQLSAIAFTLSFDYSNPELAKVTLDTLIQRFMEEDAALRRKQNAATSAFLEEELTALDVSIKAQEASIASYRARYGESGPSAVMFNQQASLSTSVNLQNVENQISAAEATVSGLSAQLASTSPYSTLSEDGRQILSAGSQLHNLESQEASLRTRYGPAHPDVMKIEAQIAALKASGDVKAGRKTQDADNPAYVQLNAQLMAAQAQLRALTGQRAALAAQQQKLSAAIAQNPISEQQLSKLTLELDNAKAHYRSLLDKKLAADLNARIESGEHGGRFSIISPATVPDSTSPKRLYLILAGLFLAVMGGVGMVILAELFSQSVRGSQHLTSIIGVAPLVTIPPITPRGAAHG